jgi:transposase InsO family protein
VGRSSYYDWLRAQPSARAQENQRLSIRIQEVFMENYERYGSRRIRKLLQSEGEIISRRRVGKLMKQQGLCCKTKRKFRVTTDTKHSLPIAPHLLKRDFTATAPD